MCAKCCGSVARDVKTADPCVASSPHSTQGQAYPSVDDPVHDWFGGMVQRCYDVATRAREQGRPIVGIMCEFTPRELIMAAGGLPVCLCGGDANMIPAAEEQLPANLCPLIKSTYGYSVNKANPFLEMADLLVAETTCDGKKKMYELLSQRHPMHVLELPQKPDDPNAFEHWVQELIGLRQALAGRFGVAIDDDRLRRAIREMNRERHLRRELAALMKMDAPPLTGSQLLDLKSLISCIPDDLEQYEQALGRLSKVTPPTGAGNRPRVLLTGVPLPHGAERVLRLIEENGGLVVCQENCTGLKPILEDVDPGADDPLRAIAEKYFHLPCSVMTPNKGRESILRQLVVEYRVDCVVDLVWQACLTYDVESHAIHRLVQDELELPYLRIETDYSPSDTARIAVRVQALLEMVESGKM